MHPMLRIGLAALALAGAAPAFAQTADMKTYAGSAEVAAMIAKAEKEIKPGQPILLQPLIKLDPYKANLEYRKAPVPPAVHETEAEFFYVVRGGGTLVVGGTLIEPTRSNPTNLGGKSITGGTSQKVAAGDFFIVPENTPHWFSAIDGTLVMMSLHVPRHEAN